MSNARGGRACLAGSFIGCEDNVDGLGSLTARLEYAWGRALFYVKGGFAFGELTARENDPSGQTSVASSTKWVNG